MTRTLLQAALALLLATASVDAQSAPMRSIDMERLLTHVRVLSHDSMGGRRAGAAGGLMAREYVAKELAASGARPIGGSWLHVFSWRGGEGANVVARVEGTAHPDRVIVLGAHYDHLGTRDSVVYNGADDNASGTAALLAIARVLARAPLAHTVVLVAFDAEEGGLSGSRAFVDDGPVPLGQVALMVNMDMVARTNGVLWASGAHHTPALRPVLQEVAADAPVRLRLGHDRPGAPEGDDWTGASDHGPFHERGVPFVYFGVEDHPDYHRPSDDFDRIDAGAYLAAVRTILTALEALDAALSLDPDRP